MIGAILALVTKRQGEVFAVLVTISVVVLLSTMMLGVMKPVLSFLEQLSRRAKLGDGMVQPVLRTLAIGFLTETGKNICTEAGEKTMGQVLSAIGGIAGVFVLLPLAEAVLELLEQLL